MHRKDVGGLPRSSSCASLFSCQSVELLFGIFNLSVVTVDSPSSHEHSNSILNSYAELSNDHHPTIATI